MARLEMPMTGRKFWISIAVLIGLWVSITAGAHATEERTLVLQQSLKNRPYTVVSINGTETYALLDTAATIALIDNEFVLPDETGTYGGEHARIIGLGGKREFPIASLDTLRAGTETWLDLRVAVDTESRFPIRRSVLPISIFETNIVDFDFTNRRVHLYDGRPRRVTGGTKSSVKYSDVNNLIFLPIEMNGVRGTALIDTGADLSFVNQRFADVANARLDEERTKILQGIDLAKNWASIHQFRRLEFGDHFFKRLTLPVVTTDLFTELGFEADEPMMVMGMDLLSHFRMQVDRKRSRVTFVLAPERDRRSRER